MPRKNPFLPPQDTLESITITFSELDSYRQCPLKWFWAYNQGWREEAKVGSPLSRGSLWHEVMELNYVWLQRNPNADPGTIRRWIKQKLLIDPTTGEQNEDQRLVEWMLQGHHEAYGRDENWEILEVEAAHRVRLGPPNSRFNLQFKIDLLVRDRKSNQIILVDHKSARDFSRRVEIDVADQFGLYSWGLRQLGVDVMATVRSDARTQRNKTKPMALDARFRRVPTFRTQKELSNIAADAYDCARMAYNAQGVVYSSPDPNLCSWKCQFLQPHLMVRKGFDVEQTLTDFGFQRSTLKHREYTTNPLLEEIPA